MAEKHCCKGRNKRLLDWLLFEHLVGVCQLDKHCCLYMQKQEADWLLFEYLMVHMTKKAFNLLLGQKREVVGLVKYYAFCQAMIETWSILASC